jgi:hypothetical protein
MRMTTIPTEVGMRGDDRDEQGAMWSYVPMEQHVPSDHPLRAMRGLDRGSEQRKLVVPQRQHKIPDERQIPIRHRLLTWPS